MSYLTTRPARKLNPWWDEDFGNMFEGFFKPTRWIEEAESKDLVPAIDITEREHDYVVHAEMPGVKKEDIDVQVENGVLTITGSHESKSEQKEGETVLRRERHYGKYVRSLRLGRQVDASRVDAQYKDGILELTLPKAEEVKPKKISVKVG